MASDGCFNAMSLDEFLAGVLVARIGISRSVSCAFVLGGFVVLHSRSYLALRTFMSIFIPMYPLNR